MQCCYRGKAGEGSAATPGGSSPTASASDVAGVVYEDNAASGLLVQRISGALPGLSLDELVGQADLVVTGRVSGRSQAFLVEPADGADPRFFTDVNVTVDEVLFGTPVYADAAAGVIDIRVAGGAGELVETVDDGAPAFADQEGYLLFLYQVDDGTAYNTPGDHYFVVGVATGAWEETETGEFSSPCYQPDGVDMVDGDDVRAAVAPSEAMSASAQRMPSVAALMMPPA